MKYLVVLCFAFTALTAISAIAAEKPIFEVGVSPGLSYNHETKLQGSAGLFFKAPVSEHWQAKVSDDALVGNRGAHRFNLGSTYNFSENWAESTFAGAGIGWQESRFDGARRPRLFVRICRGRQALHPGAPVGNGLLAAGAGEFWRAWAFRFLRDAL